ncbi:hypothetical protein NCS52_00886400 [Fusarium sp. LHS14.1]|nr:hypothetical protein NCS52_00886400 [Fusarium sp. LHS14.1]
MLGSSLLLTATAAISFLPGHVNAAPAVTIERHENGTVTYGMDYTEDDGNVLGRRRVIFQFEGCSDPQVRDIYGAWNSMLDMAGVIKDKVNFNEDVAKDYLGHPSRNNEYQQIFKGQTPSLEDRKRGDYINWCPEWFNLKTCNDAASKYSKDPDDYQRHNMVNYQCREQAMVHELFYLDENLVNLGNFVSHVTDRRLKIQGRRASTLANGPLYTKVLALYAKEGPGFWVATNADNLAFYILGKWIQERFGLYPYHPIAKDVPVDAFKKAKRDDEPTDNPPDTPDVWDPIRIVDGLLALGDLNDLAVALGAGSREEARELYSDDPDACLDLVGDGENEDPVCVDRGEVVELEAPVDLGAGPVSEGDDPNGPDAEVVTAQEPEAAPTGDIADAFTAVVGEPLPNKGPDAEVATENAEPAPTEVNLPEGTDLNGPDSEVVPNQGAEVIPNKGAQSSVPSNSTTQA